MKKQKYIWIETTKKSIFVPVPKTAPVPLLPETPDSKKYPIPENLLPHTKPYKRCLSIDYVIGYGTRLPDGNYAVYSTYHELKEDFPNAK